MPCRDLLNHILGDFQAILGENLVGIYVHGSIAFGCFSPERSDVDFIAVVKQPLTHDQQTALIRALMARTPEAPPKGIEMSVVLAQYCRDFIYPTPFELHFSNTHWEDYTLDLDGHCRELHGGADPDLAAHFAVIRAVGQPLFGPPPAELFAPVPREALLDSILMDVGDFAGDPLYHTLNLCRALAFIEENRLLSKAQGVHWALGRLPESVHPLLEAALHSYTDGTGFSPGADLEVFRDMMRGLIFNVTIK